MIVLHLMPIRFFIGPGGAETADEIAGIYREDFR
jgi:hypothetical protein